MTFDPLRGKLLLAYVSGLILLAACSRPDPTALPINTSMPSTLLPTIAAELDIGNSDAAEAGVTLLESFRGDVQPQQEAIFGITGQAGDPVRIEAQVRIGQPDIVLHLTSPTGEAFASVNVSGPGESEVIGEFRFPTDSFYELAVESLEGEGQIDILVYRLPGEQLSGGGTLSGFDQPVNGSIERPGTFHTYKVRVERGQRFDIAAVALLGNLDLVLELYDTDGNLIAARDDTLGLDPYVFNYMPQKSGEYTIVVTNFEETSGAYQVTLQQPDSGGQLTIGRRDAVFLSQDVRRSELLNFIGTAGDGLRIEAQPINPATDLTLTIFDVFGNRLIHTDVEGPGQSEILGLVQLPFDGPYQLEVDTLTEGGQVAYSVQTTNLADLKVGGPILPSEAVQRVPVSQAGTVHAYWFEGEEGQLITIDATSKSGALDMAFGIYGPAGNLLSFHDDDRDRDPVVENFRLPAAGTYRVILNIRGDNIGEYELKLTSPTPADQAADSGDG